LKKYNFVYITTNIVNSKIYIGVHSTNNIDDGYLGSGTNLKKSIKKYIKENFIREVLYYFDTIEECYQKELEIVNVDFIKNDNNYNISIGGNGGALFAGHKHSEESKNKISEKLKGKMLSDYTKKKISKNHGTAITIKSINILNGVKTIHKTLNNLLNFLDINYYYYMKSINSHGIILSNKNQTLYLLEVL